MKPAIIDIAGIGPAAASALGEHGFSSVRKLATASVAQVNTVPGFSAARAQKVIAAAAELLAGSTDTAVAEMPEKTPKDKKSRKDKKNKKKKDKKNKKDKKRKNKK